MPTFRPHTLLLFLMWMLASLPPAARGADIDIPFQKFTLANGLTLIVHEDHKAPLVAVDLWYHVGSKNERPGQTGFAHLFEHLMFNGSENFHDEYFAPFEKAGATDLNGTTSHDRTNYFATVPGPALDMALWMESERMANLLPAVDQARLDEQRGVVKNEKRQGEDKPFGRVPDYVAADTYPSGHPYSWNPIGSMADLDAASLDAVRHWFKTYYGPTNAVLVVAGDVDPQEVERRVEHYFGAIPPGPPLNRARVWIARRAQERRASMQDRVPNPRLYLVWNTPPLTDPASDRLALVGDLLAGDASGFLQRNLIQREKLATRVNAFQNDRELGGQFWIIADPAPGIDLETLERRLRALLRDWQRSGPDQDSLRRAQLSYRAALLRQLEKVGGFSGKADLLASGEVFAGDPLFYRRGLDTVASSDAATLRDTARDWLDAGVYVLHVTPFGDYSAGAERVDRSRVPAPGPAPQPQLPPLQHAVLDNGMQLLLARRPGLPLVELEWQLSGGRAVDGWPGAGTADFTLQMLSEGSRGQDSAAIAARLRGLGAEIQPFSTLDAAGLRLSALTEKLDDSAALFAQLIREPDFAAPAVERLRDQTLARLRREQADAGALVKRLLPRLLFGAQHPYAGPLSDSGRGAVIEALDGARLRAYHRQWFSPQRSTLIAVGDIDMPTFKALAQRHFGNWRAAEAADAPPLPGAAQPAGAAIYLVDLPGSAQAGIAGAVVVPAAGGLDMDALTLANNALGGGFTSRINLNLREDKHWSYGTYSSLLEARGPQLFIASGGVQIDKAGAALAELRKEWEGFVGPRPLTGAELNKVREQRVRQLPGAYETNGDLLQALSKNLRLHRPDDALADEGRRLQALQLPQVQRQAAVFAPGAVVWLVVGDRAQILPQLRELGWGHIVELDKEGNVLGGGGDPALRAPDAER